MPKELFYYNNNIPLHLGTLSTKNARFCLNIFHTLSEYAYSNVLSNNKNFLLAVSSGIDSVVMLAVFCACQRYFNYTLHAVHFNHGIRKESEKEEILFQNICTRFNIPYTVGKGNTPNYAKQQKIGLEEAGRKLRYNFFSTIQQKYQSILCTAHHANDLTEDILMRLIRGTVWPKLGGMEYFDEKRLVWRPFLYTPKKDLQYFAEELNLPYANDLSNLDTQFTRNRIRHTLMPLLEKENPQFLKNIININQNAKSDSIHFQMHVQDIMLNLEEKDSRMYLPLSAISNKDQSVRMHCYTYLINKLNQNLKLTETKGHPINATLKKLDKAVYQKKGNTIFKFSEHIRIQIKNNMLICFIKSE